MHNFNDLRIAVAGTGYVGLSIATLLAQHHQVIAVGTSRMSMTSWRASCG